MKKIIIILLAVLVLIAGGAGGYYLGYQKGTEQTEQHDLGYEAGSGAGYQAESEADYQSGYNDGLSKGYKDGEEEGYLAGYRDCQAGKEKPKPEPYLLNVAGPLDASNFIQSGLIQGWAIRFFNLVITDISVSDYILVLASTKSDRIGWERLKVVAGPVTKITKAVLFQLLESREELLLRRERLNSPTFRSGTLWRFMLSGRSMIICNLERA